MVLDHWSMKLKVAVMSEQGGKHGGKRETKTHSSSSNSCWSLKCCYVWEYQYFNWNEWQLSSCNVLFIWKQPVQVILGGRNLTATSEGFTKSLWFSKKLILIIYRNMLKQNKCNCIIFLKFKRLVCMIPDCFLIWMN